MSVNRERAVWVGVGVLLVLAGVSAFAGFATGSFVYWIAAVFFGSAGLGGVAGFLAVSGRDPQELQDAVDWRVYGPAAVCFGGAALATAGDFLGYGPVAGVELVAFAGVGFAGAFAAFAVGSWRFEGRPRVAAGELAAAAGWLVLFFGPDGPAVWAGLVLLGLGGLVAVAAGPAVEEARRRFGADL